MHGLDICIKEVCELRVLITLILLQTFILIFPSRGSLMDENIICIRSEDFSKNCASTVKLDFSKRWFLFPNLSCILEFLNGVLMKKQILYLRMT
jgi:hypothetical protein